MIDNVRFRKIISLVRYAIDEVPSMNDQWMLITLMDVDNVLEALSDASYKNGDWQKVEDAVKVFEANRKEGRSFI